MKIAVIGIGAMGRWFATELASTVEVATADRDPSRTIPGLRPLRTPDELAAFAPDMVLNAVSIENTVEAFREAEPSLPPGCVLVDVASLKARVFEHYADIRRRFASLHPMFGPSFANLGRPAGETAIMIRESQAEAKEFFRTFFEARGLNVLECSLTIHETLMASALAVPAVAAIGFAAAAENPAEVPGASFGRLREFSRRMLRENPGLIAEILFNPHTPARLEAMCRQLEYLKHVILARDAEEVGLLLDRLRAKLDPGGAETDAAGRAPDGNDGRTP